MGFFKDFKRDFAQAVNELIPDKDELDGEYDDEDMVNTFDENDNMDIAPEDLLEDIDDYGDNGLDIEQQGAGYQTETGNEYSEPEADETKNIEEQTDELAGVPDAELISEHDFNDLDEMNVSEEDELNNLDALDDVNMMEGLGDANLVDSDTEYQEGSEEGYYGNPFEQINETKAELHDMDLQKDIEAAISKEEQEFIDGAEDLDDLEEEKTEVAQESQEVESVTDSFPKADQFREDVMAEVELNSQTNDVAKDIENVFEVDTTYITKKTVINGNLSTEGSLDVLGAVYGDVSCNGKLIIGGTIKGNVIAGEIYANAAKVEGAIEAEGSVKIGVGSIVVGDIAATSAVVAGAVNGDIDVHGPVIVDSTAVIMGNIKSRSVQINNGAVIEGFCSQCYSEIDVKSFFELEEENEEEAKTEDTSEEKEESKTSKKKKSNKEDKSSDGKDKAEEDKAENDTE